MTTAPICRVPLGTPTALTRTGSVGDSIAWTEATAYYAALAVRPGRQRKQGRDVRRYWRWLC